MGIMDEEIKEQFEEVWKAIANIEKSLSMMQDSCDSENEEIWTAISNLDKDFKKERALTWDAIAQLEKNFCNFKEEMNARMSILYEDCDKKT